MGTARDHKGPADEEGGVASGTYFFFASVGWLVGWLGSCLIVKWWGMGGRGGGEIAK